MLPWVVSIDAMVLEVSFSDDMHNHGTFNQGFEQNGSLESIERLLILGTGGAKYELLTVDYNFAQVV